MPGNVENPAFFRRWQKKGKHFPAAGSSTWPCRDRNKIWQFLECVMARSGSSKGQNWNQNTALSQTGMECSPDETGKTSGQNRNPELSWTSSGFVMQRGRCDIFGFQFMP